MLRRWAIGSRRFETTQCIPLEYDVPMGNRIPTFRDNLIPSFSAVKRFTFHAVRHLDLEDKAIMFNRNVRTRLHIDTASYSGKKSVYENGEKETSSG